MEMSPFPYEEVKLCIGNTSDFSVSGHGVSMFWFYFPSGLQKL